MTVREKTFSDGMGDESDDAGGTGQGTQAGWKGQGTGSSPRASLKGIQPCQHL